MFDFSSFMRDGLPGPPVRASPGFQPIILSVATMMRHPYLLLI